MKVRYTFSKNRISFEAAQNPICKFHLIAIEHGNGELLVHSFMEPAFESAENKGEIDVSDNATPKQIFQHI